MLISRRFAHLSVAALVILLSACASLPTDYPRTESQFLTATTDTRLGQGVAMLAATHGQLSGVHPLQRGPDALAARLQLSELADRTLDAQYYIWHTDTTGMLLADALVRAADRGVRVRVLLDDLGTAPDDQTLLALDHHPYVEVRLFNPIALRDARLLGTATEFGRVNRRMHNKSFTADNQATIVGGRNIGDEYFGAAEEVNFADFDVLAIGPVVVKVSTSFDRFWNSPASIPIAALTKREGTDAELEQARQALREHTQSQQDSIYAQELRNSERTDQLRSGTLNLWWGEATVVGDDPAKISINPKDNETHLLPQLAPIVAASTSELLLVSPYFVPGDEGVEWLQSIRQRGVRIVVLTNSLAANDVAAVHAGYKRYRKDLLDAGVELWEIKPTAKREDVDSGHDERKSGSGLSGSSNASLHAKSFAFDRRVLFVGSLNLDPRSANLNTEIGVLFDTPELTAKLAGSLLNELPQIAYRVQFREGSRNLQWIALENGSEVRFDKEPMASGWLRFKVGMFSILPIESQL